MKNESALPQSTHSACKYAKKQAENNNQLIVVKRRNNWECKASKRNIKVYMSNDVYVWEKIDRRHNRKCTFGLCLEGTSMQVEIRNLQTTARGPNEAS